MQNRLFVGNLPWSIDDEGLKNLFEGQGEVVSANVITDRDTGRSRGFGFVEFADEATASAAADALNGSEVDGREITVSIARPREE